ncbi:MAG: VWA domain-containing protein, partial [Verrucomicrobiota bacterium]|nr:VWA domain-containing protein [Verrucomicrobiota bacterium]
LIAKTMVTDSYYYADASKKPVGPYSLEELHALAARGVITPTTKVIAKGDKSWVAYAQLPQAPAAAAPTPPVVAPTPSPTPTESTANAGGSFLTKLPKPLVFSLVGAIGCLIGGIGAELLLSLFPEPSKEKLNVCLLIDTSLSMAGPDHAKSLPRQQIAILMDTSSSMAGGRLIEVKKASYEFVSRQKASNRQFTVVEFDSSASTVQALTDKTGLLEAAISSLTSSGGTRLDLGLAETKTALRLNSDREGILQDFVVIFTDGASGSPSNDLIVADELRKAGVTILAIYTQGANQAHLAKVTGDKALIFPTSAGSFGEAFKKVEALIEGKGKVVDSSEIGPDSKILKVKQASSDFTKRQQTNQLNIAVLQFGDDAGVAQVLTTKTTDIVKAIDELELKGETALDLGLKKIRDVLPPIDPNSVADSDWSAQGRDFVIVFTDGKPNDEEAALSAAQDLRRTGVQIYAIHTADAPGEFLEQLTGSAEQVISTSSSSIDDAFKFVEEKIAFGLTGEGGGGMFSQLLRDSIRFALSATLLALALTVAQNILTAGSGAIRWLSPQQLITALAIGGAAGFLAGGISLLFQLISINQLVVFAGRIVAWGLLAAVIGWAMIFVIANFNALRATAGGLIGGLIGGGIFSLISFLLRGEGWATLGNLLGAMIVGAMIGLVIAWVEQLTRKAWLTVFWTANQHSNINLGAKPVTIGGGDDDIRIKGLGENLLSILLVDGRILCTQQPGNKETELKDQSVLNLGQTRLVVHAQKEE